MSKHKHHNEHNNSGNPFSEGASEKTIQDIQESLDSVEDTESISTDENNVNEKSEENNSEIHKEEIAEEEKNVNKDDKKSGLFDGLFGKKTDEETKKLKEAYDTLNNQYLRLAADFDNYRKRQESERESLIKFGMEQALKKMIEIADNFSRAEKAMEKIDDCEKAKESFQVLNKQFKDSLTKLGLEEIMAEGEIFNPNLHEAVMQVPTDEKPEDTIMQEMQKGYKYGDKVLRPSMVSVAVSK